LKKLIFPENREFSNTFFRLLTNYVFAQTITAVSGIMSYPLDTVRRRLMMQAGAKGKKPKGPAPL